jgi:hypothetical protein
LEIGVVGALVEGDDFFEQRDGGMRIAAFLMIHGQVVEHDAELDESFAIFAGETLGGDGILASGKLGAGIAELCGNVGDADEDIGTLGGRGGRQQRRSGDHELCWGRWIAIESAKKGGEVGHQRIVECQARQLCAQCVDWDLSTERASGCGDEGASEISRCQGGRIFERGDQLFKQAFNCGDLACSAQTFEKGKASAEACDRGISRTLPSMYIGQHTQYVGLTPDIAKRHRDSQGLLVGVLSTFEIAFLY